MILLTIFLITIPLILVIALFTRKGITTEASIDIKKSQQQVFDYLVLMKNQEHYNAWLMVDPKMKKNYTGTDSQPGFVLAWDSKNKKDGKASQRITNVLAPEKIEVEITFEKPVTSKARYWFELSSVNDTETYVTWKYEGNPTPYYFLRVSQIVFRLKKYVTRYMQLSLTNLKNILER